MVILVLLKSSEIEIYEKSGIYTLKFQKNIDSPYQNKIASTSLNRTVNF